MLSEYLGIPNIHGKKLMPLVAQKFESGSPLPKNIVLAEPVPNNVWWINPQLKSNYDFQYNSSHPLGVFVNERIENIESIVPLEIWPAHNRSGLLVDGQIVTDGKHVYQDIDLKGIGFISLRSDGIYIKLSGRIRPNGDFDGLMTKEDAVHDTTLSELFHAEGIRTHRTVAILDIAPTGIITTDQNIKEEFVIQQRAYKSRGRVEDLVSPMTLLDKLKLLANATEVISSENSHLRLDLEIYKEYMRQQIIDGVKKIRGLGLTNPWYTIHNITLDGGFTDYDDVGPVVSDPYLIKKGVFAEKSAEKHKIRAYEVIGELNDQLYRLTIHVENNTETIKKELSEKDFSRIEDLFLSQ